MEKLITIDNVSKSYVGKYVLDTAGILLIALHMFVFSLAVMRRICKINDCVLFIVML